jgi:hypothetical protein
MYCLSGFDNDHAVLMALLTIFISSMLDLDRMSISFYRLQAGLYLLHDELMSILIEK